MALSLIINGKHAAFKKDISFEYISENRYFTQADDFSMDIELPLKGCTENIEIFGYIVRKDVDPKYIYLDAILQNAGFVKKGAVVITEINEDAVKVQFLENRSFQNYYPEFDEKYINELDLGNWPNMAPKSEESGTGMTGRPRPNVNGDSDECDPKDVWARWEDYTALPWVNNTSGAMQNCIKYNENNEIVWKVNPDDDDDQNFTNGLSFQPNLLWLTKKICTSLGYEFDFYKWEQSIYKYLMVMNTLPYSWNKKKWHYALPSWSINEFFHELEKLLGCEFDINHRNKFITCIWNDEIELGNETINLVKVVDEYAVEVSNDDETDFIPGNNLGYAESGKRLENIDNCQWYIDNKKREDGTITCTTWKTLKDLIDSQLKYDAILDYGGSRSDYATYPGGKWGIHYVIELDTYFVLEVMHRVHYRDDQLNPADNWANICRLVPINRFGNLIIDEENKDDIEQMNIVPVWLDCTDDNIGLMPFLECGEIEVNTLVGSPSHNRRYGNEASELDEVINFGAFLAIDELNANTTKKEFFSKLFVAFWDGEYKDIPTLAPHPWIDKFEIDYSFSFHKDPNDYVNWVGDLNIKWLPSYAKKDFSLRINNEAYGSSRFRNINLKIDRKTKYNFSFLADEIPNVRAIFFIEGKKYLCAKITATFTQQGMKELIKGEFYRII